MTDEACYSGELSGDEEADALIFHIAMAEPLTKLK